MPEAYLLFSHNPERVWLFNCAFSLGKEVSWVQHAWGPGEKWPVMEDGRSGRQGTPSPLAVGGWLSQ